LKSENFGEVLTLGDINIDTVWPIDRLPEPGHDAYVQAVSSGLGGATLNTAIVLDRLGQAAAVLSCLGSDPYAGQARAMISQTGVNQTYIVENAEHDTGLIFILVTPDGERTMITYRGANVYYRPEDVPETAFKTASILHISGYSLLQKPQADAVWRAVAFAQQYHVAISLDTGLEPALIIPEELRQLIAAADICISGPKETAQLFGTDDPQKAARHLLNEGVQLTGIKLGEKGCYLADAKADCFCPAFNVEVKDTTGAGDSFTAGLLYGWLRGWDLPACAVLGSALGALAATVHGAGLALPTKAETLKFLGEEHTADISRKEIEKVIASLA
jgi:Sugar kinases, ribokinase family